MDETEEQAEDTPKKKSKLPLIIGLVLMIVGGGGGFYAVYSGMVLGQKTNEEEATDAHVEGMPDIAFVELAPMTVSLLDNGRDRHLRFQAQLETPSQFKSDVEKLLPRIVDVLNSYLRAVELDDLKDTAALVKLRAQMLRRVQIVVGDGRINDLLIMEFVLN